jgi:hypothetical protein
MEDGWPYVARVYVFDKTREMNIMAGYDGSENLIVSMKLYTNQRMGHWVAGADKIGPTTGMYNNGWNLFVWSIFDGMAYSFKDFVEPPISSNMGASTFATSSRCTVGAVLTGGVVTNALHGLISYFGWEKGPNNLSKIISDHNNDSKHSF